MTTKTISKKEFEEATKGYESIPSSTDALKAFKEGEYTEKVNILAAAYMKEQMELLSAIQTQNKIIDLQKKAIFEEQSKGFFQRILGKQK